MAMNKQRRTANLNNIVTYDTLKNVTLLADLTIEGLTGAGFVKADANGLLSVDTGAYLPMPSQTGNAGKFLSTDGSVLSWQSVPQDVNIYNNDGTLTGNRTITSGGFNLTFTGSNTAASAISRGLNLTHTLVAAANNDTLVGLDINPTFTNGAFTGVKNYGIRLQSGNYLQKYVTNAVTDIYGGIGSGYSLFGTSHAAGGYVLWLTSGLTSPNDYSAGYGVGIGNPNYSNIQLIYNNANIKATNVTIAASSVLMGYVGAGYTSFFHATPYTGFEYYNLGGWNFGIREAGTTNYRLAISGSTGNVIIGGTTDAGYKLDVQGTGRYTANLMLDYGGFNRTGTQGAYSIAIGSGSGIGLASATNDNSVVIGGGANSSGIDTVAIGNSASGSNFSVAIGRGVTASTNEFVVGQAQGPITTMIIGSSRLGLASTAGNNLLFMPSPAQGTNLNGGNITIGAGRGTGTGTPGDIVFSTSSSTTSGTTLQSLTERMRVFGSTGNVLIQSGGTFSDAGYKLDVQGTGRFTEQVNASSFNSVATASRGGYSINYAGSSYLIIGQFFGNSGSTRTNAIISRTIDSGVTNANLLNLFSNNTFQFDDSAAYAGQPTATSASAFVEIKSTTKGFLPPRMTNAQRTAISTPATGLMAYSTDATEGMYLNLSGGWQRLLTSGDTTANIYNSDGTLTGNRTVTMGSYTLSFDKDISINGHRAGRGSGGIQTNTTFGNNAGSSTTQPNNTTIGNNAGANITSLGNTIVGSNAVQSGNLSGSSNSVFGFQTYLGGTGANNNYFGAYSAQIATSGSSNCGFGNESLRYLVTGSNNAAFGFQSLYSNTGSNNTSIGYFSGGNNTTGSNNIFIGYNSTGASVTDSNRTWIGNSSTTSTWLGGNLLLGTTTDAGYKLDVQGTGRFTGATIIGSGTDDLVNAAAYIFRVGGSIRMTGNNLQIGASSPGVDAHIEFTTSKVKINQFGSSGTSSVSIIGLASGNNTVAVGLSSSASGTNSIAIGQSSASAYNSVAIGASSTANGIGAVAIGSTSTIAGANEFVSGGPYNEGIFNVYFGSGKTRSNIVAQSGAGDSYTINGSGAFGTDFAGGNITIAGGKGTGTGTPGDIILATSTPTTTGTTLQSLTNRVWIKGETGNVGIGTTSPSQRLSVSGNAQVSHSYTHTSGAFTSGLSSYVTASTALSPTYTSGMFYGALSTFYQNEFEGSATVPNSVIMASQLNGTRVRFINTNTTITMTQGSSGIRAISNQILQFQFDNAQASCVVSHVAGSQILAPYYVGSNNPTITNYYGLVLNPSNEYSGTLSVTNRWGIYQAGTSDNNWFAGKVIIGSTNTVGSSPLNVKGLPTSSAGLSTGDVWNDAGTLKIV